MFIDVVQMSKKFCQFPIKGKLVYATKENFLGRPVDGYQNTDIFLLSPKTAQALCHIQNELNQQGLGLFVYDAYRPLRAVKDFAKWATLPISNDYEMERKQLHFPLLEKEALIQKGYIADAISGHCYGNVVDLTLMDLKTQEVLDMGTIFDYFGELSHHACLDIGEKCLENRRLLLSVMEKHGFDAYAYEYWHYSYKEREVNEPQDFVII
jgi:D-alanyl-D-alanine dipeptidase